MCWNAIFEQNYSLCVLAFIKALSNRCLKTLWLHFQRFKLNSMKSCVLSQTNGEENYKWSSRSLGASFSTKDAWNGFSWFPLELGNITGPAFRASRLSYYLTWYDMLSSLTQSFILLIHTNHKQPRYAIIWILILLWLSQITYSTFSFLLIRRSFLYASILHILKGSSLSHDHVNHFKVHFVALGPQLELRVYRSGINSFTCLCK